MIIRFLILCLMASLATVSHANRGRDGHTFVRPSHVVDTMTVTMRTYPNSRALQQEARRLGIVVHREGQGTSLDEVPPPIEEFAHYNLTNRTCTIHVVAPENDYQPEWIGHGITHCFRGEWHPRHHARAR